MKSVEEQLALIKRGIDALVPEDEFKKKLERSVQTGKPLRIKYGIDPTGIDVHLGHTVPLRKMRLFQDLGHQAVLILGNYTALVGDPTGRDKSRERLTAEQVEENAKDYLKQVSRVIDIEKTEVHRNGDWFGNFAFTDVLSLLSKITVQQMLERDDFSKRYKAGKEIRLHECLYPLMQGHDSVEICADVELGGSEQLFNLMVGRDLQKDAEQSQQICLTLPILRGLDGVRRMGKSLGNYVGVAEKSFDQFAKIMQIPDDLMTEWFELLTDRSLDEIKTLTNPEKTHPREAKIQLGKDIVSFYSGGQAANDAAQEWLRVVSGGEDPSDIPIVTLAKSDLENGEMQLPKLLIALGMVKSGNEARRVIQQGGAQIGEDRQKISDPKANVKVEEDLIVRVGKKKVVKVHLE